MQPRGLEGRAQHGHSSSAHSTPGDQCCGCQRDGQVVVWWWVNCGVSQYRCVHVCENRWRWDVNGNGTAVATEMMHQPMEKVDASLVPGLIAETAPQVLRNGCEGAWRLPEGKPS